MNQSQISLKSILVLLFVGLLTFNLITLSSFTANATEGGCTTCTCKWKAHLCPENIETERCVEDGDGNSCPCGAITRKCMDEE